MNNNFEKFNLLRQKYSTFIFEKYEMFEDAEGLTLKYYFNIPNLVAFTPEIKILKKQINFKKLEGELVQNLVFHLGLIELVSYWKATCSPKVIIECGYLKPKQIAWFKKLYYLGLGELFYQNGIKTTEEEFMQIECRGSTINNEVINDELFNGTIIPIGGGKDSTITLEALKEKDQNYCLIVNPKSVSLACATEAGYEAGQIIEVKRTIDPQILRLNAEGFINGHTPFSALLAFLSYFVAFMTNKKYIALSNESSANESNVVGENINHQYSKSYEFEKDFIFYTSEYLKTPIHYFSFLRPLNELQIAKLFSKQPGYHAIFKSCNVGSKGETWQWCGTCPKCLFVFIILSPFLYPEKLVKIFNQDLFEREDLLKLALELLGHGDIKPFECVGTFEEAQYAISLTIQNLRANNAELPYLLKYYEEHYPLADLTKDLIHEYNEDHNLPGEFNDILKEMIAHD